MGMKIKKTKNTHIDEGVYKAVVSQIQEKQGNFGNFYIWTFLVKGAMNDEQPIEGVVKVTGLTSETFSENSKMYKWARACGLDVESDEIDLERAIKAIVRITIEDDEDKDGRVWSKVKQIRSAGRVEEPAKKAPKKVEKEEEEDEEEEAPPKKTHKVEKPVATKKKPVEVEEEEEEEEETEEEEDTPPPAKKAAAKPSLKVKKDKEEEEEEEEELFDFGKEDDDVEEDTDDSDDD